MTGCTKYGPTAGLLEFREAIAAHVSKTRGVKVGPDNVCVVPGGKPIMFFVMMALLEEGDEVIYPDPSFPIYESLISFLGAIPKPVPLVESRGFSFDLNVLKDQLSSKTKLVILNSPANPTGGVISKEDLRQIADMLRERDLMILSDEIYCRIFYEQEPSSITSFEGILDKTVILDGFSKTYSMTGWRLGFGVMPQKLADAVNLLMVNSNSCTATFTQKAGLAALQGPQDDVTTMVAEFRKAPGCHCETPQRNPRLSLHDTGRSVLRVPQRYRHRDLLKGTRGSAALRGGSRVSQWNGLRKARRRLSAIQLRQLTGEH